MSLPILNALPDSTGYRLIDGNNPVNSGPLDGGASRSRADLLGASSTCDVQWTCDPTRYSYLMAFYRRLHNGADTFQTLLIFEQASALLYTVKFVPNTFGLVSQAGFTFVIGATLEVTPQTIDLDADQSLIDIYGTYGNGSWALLNELNNLVNVVFPATL